MPGTSGIDVVVALRSDPETATLPILLITGSGDDETVLVALEAGADDFLSKPVRLDELVARIRAHLRTRSAWTNQVASELRARADLVGALGHLALSSEPDDAAAALVTELGRSAGCEFVGVLQIADRGRLNVLATYNGSAGVQRGGTLNGGSGQVPDVARARRPLGRDRRIETARRIRPTRSGRPASSWRQEPRSMPARAWSGC